MPGRPKYWAKVDVACDSEAADILAAELADEFGTAVEFTPEGIRFYLEWDRFAVDEARIGRLVQSALPQTGHQAIDVSRIEDEDWSQTWKAYFKPLRVGRRFLVAPTWEEVSPGPSDVLIRLDPGRAFGTGHHETTRLCLEWLEGLPRETIASASLLDVGTGSGILAMAAALLGFEKVIGIDNDPEAIEVAVENIELNGLSEKAHVSVAEPRDIKGGFDVVISNIQSGPLITMSEAISSLVKKPGRLALSGLLLDQTDAVGAEYEKRGLRLTGQAQSGEWALLAFEK